MSKDLGRVIQGKTGSSLLSQANEAQRTGNLSLALTLYEKLVAEADGLIADQVNFNLSRVRKKLGVITGFVNNEGGVRESGNQIEIDDNLRKEIEDVKAYFSVKYYLAKYEDIKSAGVDPVLHYCMQGWRELRDPHPNFSTKTYLELHEDVDQAKVNPFWHYIVVGRSEGRAIRHPGGIRLEILKKLPTLEGLVNNWLKKGRPKNLLDIDDVLEIISVATRDFSKKSNFIISLSHDNYRVVPGGLQLCIQREEQLATSEGHVYLNLHPWQPLPVLTKSQNPLLQMLINGKAVGTCEAATANDAIRRLKSMRDVPIVLVIHSLLGHSLARVKELAGLVKKNSTYFWLHDFFSLCPSYALQRNNVSYCASSPLNSNSCLICIYGRERIEHSTQMEDFFSSTKINIISPSQVTMDFWASKANYPSISKNVIPHRTVEWKKNSSIESSDIKPSKISIAYVGGPVFHKGWFVFKELMQSLEGNSDYVFYHFGKNFEEIDDLEVVEVHVTSDDYDAMIAAINQRKIDFFLHWANWPETFSFTTYEALAGGANVLTNAISGNVAELVRKTKRGRVFETQAELFDYLRSSDALDDARKIQVRRKSDSPMMSMSQMSLSLINKVGFGK